MTTPHTTTRRDSTATEMTLNDYTSSAADKMTYHFDDDEKTLSGLTMNESSSSRSKTKLSKAMTQLKSKLKTKDGKPKQKTSIPPDYYPNNLKTFEALADADDAYDEDEATTLGSQVRGLQSAALTTHLAGLDLSSQQVGDSLPHRIDLSD
ncbi:hypothetical protein CIB48_g737 [Xylaria polymorpha]|nr:hypothetical protein CIB48_g737 [Xylaria polymorpha]